MTIQAGDKILTLKTGSGKNVCIPLASPAVGDKVAIIKTASGKPVAVKLAAIASGDKVILVPTASGKPVAIKAAGDAWYLDDEAIPQPYCAIYTGSHHFLVGCINTISMPSWVYVAINGNVPAGTAWGSETHSVTEGHNSLYHDVESMLAISDSIILAGVNASGIWKSTDGGSSWTYITYFGSSLSDSGHYTSMVSLGGGICLCGAGYRDGSTSKFGIFRSVNSGSTPWQLKQVVESSIPFSTGSCMVDCGSGVVVFGHTGNVSSTAGEIWISTDYGVTWSQNSPDPISAGIGSLCFLGDGIILAGTTRTSSPDAIWRSTDYGATWSKITDLENTRYIRGLVHMGSGVVFAGGRDATSGDGKIWKSTDYGLNWTLDESFDDGGGQLMALANGDGNCIAVTYGGHVWVYR